MFLAFFGEMDPGDEAIDFLLLAGAREEIRDRVIERHPAFFAVDAEIVDREVRLEVVAKRGFVGVVGEGAGDIIGMEHGEVAIGTIGVSLLFLIPGAKEGAVRV